MTEEEKTERQKEWAAFKEALAWQESFWQWFRKRTYPKELLEHRDSLPADKLKGLCQEQVRNARVYIKNYDPKNSILEADFTDAIPEAMRKRYVENQAIISKWCSLPVLVGDHLEKES